MSSKKIFLLVVVACALSLIVGGLVEWQIGKSENHGGSIVGVVFKDSDWGTRGAMDYSDTKAQGVFVEIHKWIKIGGGEGTIGGGSGGILVDRVKTDEQGSYQFKNLPEGDYYISVDLCGEGGYRCWDGCTYIGGTVISITKGNVTFGPVMLLTTNQTPLPQGPCAGGCG